MGFSRLIELWTLLADFCRVCLLLFAWICGFLLPQFERLWNLVYMRQGCGDCNNNQQEVKNLT